MLAVQIGEGAIEFMGDVQVPEGQVKPNVRLSLILDTDWNAALQDGTCEGIVSAFTAAHQCITVNVVEHVPDSCLDYWCSAATT